MKSKIVVITGSTDGIGKQTALDLAKMGARIIIHGRNPEKVHKIAEKIKEVTKNNEIDTVIADLADFDQIRNMSQILHEKYDHLDILINNAGMLAKRRIIDAKGIEKTFAVNYLAPFMLTNLLLDLLKTGKKSRIINVSSQVQAEIIDFENLQGEKKFGAFKSYGISKSCLIMFSYELAEKLKKTKITVNCLHPGMIRTKMNFRMLGKSISEGAKTSVYCASSPDLENVTGKYFNNSNSEKSAEITYDEQIRKKLWEISERLTGVTYQI